MLTASALSSGESSAEEREGETAQLGRSLGQLWLQSLPSLSLSSRAGSEWVFLYRLLLYWLTTVQCS